jgi:hypothetical protein
MDKLSEIGGPMKTIAAILLLYITAVLRVCWTVNAQSTRVHLEEGSTYTQTIHALRDNQRTSIQFRSTLVRIVNHAGKAREFTARMLYDPQSKLFWWSYSETFQGYSAEWEAKQFAQFSVVYLAPNSLLVFTSETFEDPLVILESVERHDSLDRAQEGVMHFFEKEPLPSYKWQFKGVNYMKEMPPDFLKQCFSAINMVPTVEGVQRQGNQWKVTVRAQNGNAAEISLDDGYNLISTKFIPYRFQRVFRSCD